jgi:hypothetical protein
MCGKREIRQVRIFSPVFTTDPFLLLPNGKTIHLNSNQSPEKSCDPKKLPENQISGSFKKNLI